MGSEMCIRDRDNIKHEMENSEDSFKVEQGIKIFIQWLQSGKLKLRIYPESPIHAKVYIMRKDMVKCPDTFGSVITSSSKEDIVNHDLSHHFALEKSEAFLCLNLQTLQE